MSMSSRVLCNLVLAGCGLLPFAAVAHGAHEPAAHTAAEAQGSGLGFAAAFNPAGRLWVVTAQDGHVWLRHSDDLGKTLSKPVAVNSVAERIADSRENHPKIAIGAEGQIYVSWSEPLKKRWSSYVRFARSLDGGKHFSTPITVNHDKAPITHSFDALAVAGNGDVVIAWLDARDMVAAMAAGKGHHGLSVYYAWSDDGGKTFVPGHQLMDHSCECCRIALARAPDGVIATFFRGLFGDDIRDHAFARLRTDGKPAHWRRATYSDWKVAACPEQGPGLAIGADGVRHVVWYESSHGPRVWYGQLDPGHPPRHKLKLGGSGAGHADVAVHGDTVWVAWNQVSASGFRLMARVSHDGGGQFAPARAIATASAAVYSPQLLVYKDHAYAAWNTADDFQLIAVHDAGSRGKLKPLTAADVPALLKPPAQGERIVMFWALECRYCEPNLKALAKLQREYPGYVQLVTVATDPIARRDAIAARLRSMQVANYAAWAYVDATPQRLNYLIDPNWGGETPRTLAIRADGARAAASGDLNPEQLAKLRPPAAKAARAPPAVHVDHAWVRLLPTPLPAGGYFTLHNDGDHPVLLTGASSAAWGMVMLHHSRMSEGQSGMTMVDHLTIPAHGQVTFAPGGYHLMLMDAKKPLKAGEHARIVLHFKGGATLRVPFLLQPADATGP